MNRFQQIFKEYQPNLLNDIAQEIGYDLQRQLESKVKIALYKHGFDTNTDDFKRLLIVQNEHVDEMNNLWLDGSLILSWSKFNFRMDGLKLIGEFEFKEV